MHMNQAAKKNSFFWKMFDKRELESIPNFPGYGRTEPSLNISGDNTLIAATGDDNNEISALKAENARLKSQLKLVDTIINSAPFPIWVRDENMHITYCNNAYCEAADMTQEMLLGDEFIELAAGVRNIARVAFDTGESAVGKVHIVCNGERRLYEIREMPLISSGQMIGYAYDISGQEKAEEEVKLHISAQADLLESSTSAMAIYGADTRLKFYNQAFAKLWQLSEDFLDSEPGYGEILERLREYRKLPEQTNFQLYKKEHLKLFTDLIKPRDEFLYIPSGAVLRMIIIPHALGGLLFAYEDVTDRLALERSYNTLIAVQRATLDNLQQGVTVIGEDGRVKLCNPVYCKLWGLDDEFLSTQPHLADVVEKTKPYYVYDGTWSDFKEKLIANTMKREIRQLMLETSDGKYLSANFVPLPDGATLITYYDVTDAINAERSLREKNQALEEADRLKSEFLANISYELRSPLTSIKGFTEILGQGLVTQLPAKVGEYIGYIDKSSDQLMNLINDILDIASIEAGYLKLNKTSIDVRSLLNHLIALVGESARKARLDITLECAPDLATLMGDETRIKQVVFNLISNSLKFTPEGGKISLGARESSGMMEIWVADTGVGIPDREREVVTEKFYKAGSTRAHKSGAGLGLTLVKNFVGLHNGHITIESAPESGTKVSCFFPLNNVDGGDC